MGGQLHAAIAVPVVSVELKTAAVKIPSDRNCRAVQTFLKRFDLILGD